MSKVGPRANRREAISVSTDDVPSGQALLACALSNPAAPLAKLASVPSADAGQGASGASVAPVRPTAAVVPAKSVWPGTRAYTYLTRAGPGNVLLLAAGPRP